MKKSLLLAATAVFTSGTLMLMLGQPPAGRGGGGGKGKGGFARGPALSVTSSSFTDGGEVPMHNAGRGDNKSPEFEFHWSMGTMPVEQPESVQSFAIIFHDIENSTAKTTTDTLHWSAFNIPGNTKELKEGELPEGALNGPGIQAGRGYFGPGAGPGPFHHYVFEFYALDTKLDLQSSASRDELMKAMDGHIVGKAAYVGRFHAQQ